MSSHDPKQPLEEPGEATAEAGQVLMDGPDGVAIGMVPESAEETGRRLIAAARKAREQGDAADG